MVIFNNSLCILTICNLIYFPIFGFEGGIWVLIATAPDHCIVCYCYKMVKAHG